MDAETSSAVSRAISGVQMLFEKVRHGLCICHQPWHPCCRQETKRQG